MNKIHHLGICSLFLLLVLLTGCRSWLPWHLGSSSHQPASVTQPAAAADQPVEPEQDIASADAPNEIVAAVGMESTAPPSPMDQAADMTQFMEDITADLLQYFLDQELIKNAALKQDYRFLYSSFVDQSNYDETTPLGRLLGDALATNIQNEGFQVIEIRLSKAMRIHKEYGIVALSQDLQKLMDEHQASFIITGSYTLTPVGVYVSAKIIGKTSQIIYSSAGRWLPRTTLIDYLLNYQEPVIKIEEMN
ncbi:MAG: hypothetical protein JXO49_06940 [Deltaproteobacteria bacterium]|nr:hypothetical protein [Candidatus Anaeroferrophillus wilburensis]MBN2889063.1 hypothetical protein [Deltaproteobacteria bacterium]